MVRPTATATRKLAGAEQHEQARRRHPGHLQQRDDHRAARHEGGIEHVDAGHDPRAAVGAGPGLHGRKDRHDEQAAGDREPGQVDREANAAPGAEQAPNSPRDRGWARRRRSTSRGRSRKCPAAPRQSGRQQDDPSGREPGRQAPSRRRSRSRRSRGRWSPPPRCRRARSSPAAASATATPRRRARTSSSRSRPTTAGGPRAGSPSSPPVEPEDVLVRMTRSGAASPVRGINRLAPQHISENTIISSANRAGSPPFLAAMPPTMVPSRMAMKVAPSTSALPAGSSERAR